MLANLAQTRAAAAHSVQSPIVPQQHNWGSGFAPSSGKADAIVNQATQEPDAPAVRYMFPDCELSYEAAAGDKTLRYYSNWQYDRSLRVSLITGTQIAGTTQGHFIRYFFSHWEDDCYLPLFPAELYGEGINPFVNDGFSGNYDSYYAASP